MTILFYFVLLTAGFLMLIKGADWFVKGASALAKKLSISEMVIGLTIVSLGTSAPELFVNIFAGLQDKADIAFGNIIGSNVANTLLVLGAASLFTPIKAERNTVWKDIPLSLLAVIVLLILCNDIFTENSNMLSRIDGLILLLFFVCFLYYTFRLSQIKPVQKKIVSSGSFTRSLSLLAIGAVGLYFGGEFVVNYAVKIAQKFGMSERLIGFTIISIGTSLPELVTSAVAAFKGKTDLAIGNVVGSNVLNIFFVLGLSAVIAPLSFDSVLNIDIFILIAASILLFAAMFVGKINSLGKREGIFSLTLYFSYIVFLIIRN
ncbi:calcium/sodium antiporter [candidate division KSB1 bacterium]